MTVVSNSFTEENTQQQLYLYGIKGGGEAIKTEGEVGSS
jgi:hypothetical protein